MAEEGKGKFKQWVDLSKKLRCSVDGSFDHPTTIHDPISIPSIRAGAGE